MGGPESSQSILPQSIDLSEPKESISHPLKKESKSRITKKQKRAIIIGSIVLAAAIAIPTISFSVYFYAFPKRTFQFYVNHGTVSRSLTVTTTRAKLGYYINADHPHHSYYDSNYSASVIESYCTPNDQELIDIATQIRSKCLNPNDLEEVIDALLSFTQAIGYKSELNDLAKYPFETIFRKGDCEDLSVLFGSLAVAIGYNSVLILIDFYDEYDEEWGGHACIGVTMSSVPASGWHFNISGSEYFICETTAQGWLIGELPTSIPDYFLMDGYAFIN
ncbi:MAG: hypothetical protein ACW98F_00660 [Candidatus Hodarchaeales archaeon]